MYDRPDLEVNSYADRDSVGRNLHDNELRIRHARVVRFCHVCVRTVWAECHR
jgi:hypothetical protein